VEERYCYDMLASIVQESAKSTDVKWTVVRQDGVQLVTIGVSDRDKSGRPHTSSYTRLVVTMFPTSESQKHWALQTDRETDRRTDRRTQSRMLH